VESQKVTGKMMEYDRVIPVLERMFIEGKACLSGMAHSDTYYGEGQESKTSINVDGVFSGSAVACNCR